MVVAPKNEIVVPYAPRHWATEFLHPSPKRFVVLVIHRRGGKTTAALNHLHRDAVMHKNHRYAYVAPTYKQAKRIAWRMLKDIAKTTPGVSFNESELTIKYPNGSELILLGAENPDAIRGMGLNGVVMDEYAQISPVLFTEVITKCVADTLGYVIILGTPKGKGHFYRIFNVAKNDPDWLAIYRTIDDSLKHEHGNTINNLKQALEDDRKHVENGLMTQAEFDQEWYNSWEAALKGAVYGDQLAVARAEGRISRVPYDANLQVHTVWDLGIGDAMSVGFFQKPSPRETHLIDYFETTGMGLPQVAAEIKKKPYVFGKHYFPFDIKNRELSTGKTRFDAAEKLFGKDKVEVVPKIPESDGIDLGRALWARLWVDEKNCEEFVDTIGSHVYEYDEAKGVFRTKTLHDFASHCGAMFRYAATVEDEFETNGPAKKKDSSPPPPAVDDEYMGTVNPTKTKSDTGPSEDELAKM